NAMMAAEMAVIRLTHVADLPSPGDLVRKLTGEGAPASGPATGGAGPGNGGARAALPSAMAVATGAAPARVAQPAPSDRPDTLARLARFEDVLDLIRTRRDMQLLIEAERYLRLVRFAPGRIEFEPADGAPPDLAQRLSARLGEWTGTRWAISVVSSGGAATLHESNKSRALDLQSLAEQHPLVQAA